MSVNPQVAQAGQRGMPSNLNPLQQQQYTLYQQQQQQAELDQKKLQDMIDSLSFIANIQNDMNLILDNVGKANLSNNYSSILSGRVNKTNKDESLTGSNDKKNLNNQMQGSGVATPNSVSYNHQGPNSQGQQADQDGNPIMQTNEKTEDFSNMNLNQQQFFEKTESKYLQDKSIDINKNLVDLDKILRELQPIVIKDAPEFIPVFANQQNDNTVSGTKFMNNYRWVTKVQELINSTSLPVYKRYSQAYNLNKSTKYKSYSIKPIKKEELEKYVSQHLTHNEIKVVTAQKTDNEFVLDIIMPQHFKFVFLLFDCNVEKLQVKPLDIRLLKIYNANKPSDEVCSFDFEHRNVSNVLRKVEENCLFACAYFRTEYGLNHFRHILQWIKNYTNLFNAKCIRCEKHLLNGLPPTWRDLKTYEAYHDECKL